jgi:hypothetical protein
MLVSQGDLVETLYVEDLPDVTDAKSYIVVHRVIPDPDWTEGIYRLEYVRGDRPVEGKRYQLIARRVLCAAGCAE